MALTLDLGGRLSRPIGALRSLGCLLGWVLGRGARGGVEGSLDQGEENGRGWIRGGNMWHMGGWRRGSRLGETEAIGLGDSLMSS